MQILLLPDLLQVHRAAANSLYQQLIMINMAILLVRVQQRLLNFQ
nr:MAG TPA: hypothetical protein [Caudoviricetes sp.]